MNLTFPQPKHDEVGAGPQQPQKYVMSDNFIGKPFTLLPYGGNFPKLTFLSRNDGSCKRYFARRELSRPGSSVLNQLYTKLQELASSMKPIFCIWFCTSGENVSFANSTSCLSTVRLRIIPYDSLSMEVSLTLLEDLWVTADHWVKSGLSLRLNDR